MTSDDFNTSRATLGFDLAQTATWLGINPSTAWRYANGSSPIPGPVARALRLACGVQYACSERFTMEGNVEGCVYSLDPEGDWVSYADLAPLIAMEG